MQDFNASTVHVSLTNLFNHYLKIHHNFIYWDVLDAVIIFDTNMDFINFLSYTEIVCFNPFMLEAAETT